MAKQQIDEVIAKASIVSVGRTVSVDGKKAADPEDDAVEEQIAVHRFVTTPMTIKVGVGLSINLGNFEFAKLSVEMTIPCYKEEAEEAYAFAQSWVEQKVTTERDLIIAHRDKTKKHNPL